MNLLLALDHSSCSEAAVNAVCDRYRPEHTSVRVVHVVEWPRALPSEVTFAEGPSAAQCVMNVHTELRSAGYDLVVDAASRLRAAGFDATPLVLEGDARRSILKLAAEWPADTIVLGSHGRRGLDRLLVGSVAESIVRHATCSVAIIREQPAVRTTNHVDLLPFERRARPCS